MNSKKLFFMLCLAQRDIKTVISLFKKISDVQDIYEREALLISIHIIYSRIFSRNFGLPRLSLKKIKCEKLNGNEIKEHDAILKLRNSIFAHVNAETHSIDIQRNDQGKPFPVCPWHTSGIDISDRRGNVDSLFLKISVALNIAVDEYLNSHYKGKPAPGHHILMQCVTEIKEKEFKYD